MANLGTRPESGPAFPNHSNRMLVNEAALTTGIAVHGAVALRFLESQTKEEPAAPPVSNSGHSRIGAVRLPSCRGSVQACSAALVVALSQSRDSC
jgi:hypothetical protein